MKASGTCGSARRPILVATTSCVVAALAQQPPDELLAAAVAVHVGGVEEGHTRVGRGVQRGHGVVLADRTPVGAELPAAEADHRHLATRTTQHPVLHVSSPQLGRRSAAGRPATVTRWSRRQAPARRCGCRAPRRAVRRGLSREPHVRDAPPLGLADLLAVLLRRRRQLARDAPGPQRRGHLTRRRPWPASDARADEDHAGRRPRAREVMPSRQQRRRARSTPERDAHAGVRRARRRSRARRTGRRRSPSRGARSPP